VHDLIELGTTLGKATSIGSAIYKSFRNFLINMQRVWAAEYADYADLRGKKPMGPAYSAFSA